MQGLDSSYMIVVSMTQGVILKDWQGITFMMLDVLDMFAISLSTVIEVLLSTQFLMLCEFDRLLLRMSLKALCTIYCQAIIITSKCNLVRSLV